MNGSYSLKGAERMCALCLVFVKSTLQNVL